MKVLAKKRDKYFELSFHRKHKKKSKSKKPGDSGGFGDGIFWGIILLSMFLIVYMWVSFTFESLFMSVKLFSIIATLGGLETYDQTVYGMTIVFFLLGLVVIFGWLDDNEN